MQIQILSVDVKTVPTAKGSYQTAELAFKNLSFQGKVEGRKIMSFGAAASTFKVLTASSAGDVFEIEVVKNDKGFNDWVSAIPSVAGAASPAASTTSSAGSKTAAPAARSSYETPEERALRQVLIVRQSNISSAVALLSVGGKSALKVEDVLVVAKQLEQYVFGTEPDTSGFDTMTSDDVDVS